ncbi:hypothetical protein FKV24_005505 [Lysobacter maris]|uniref:Uncharacterized protein n=1 Tax=Marilutibacter maris TaxID=1605891 RepID=A0A508AX59_9GAMM|nr:hypothetical protein [Lysobacter maris]KAB8195010.1 hypothetical protein FKV24_005505 [Lysobacter maris]
MNRKLQNSLTALSTCGIALALALAVFSPAMRAGDPPPIAMLEVASGADGLVAIVATSSAVSATCAASAACLSKVAPAALHSAAPVAPDLSLIRNIKSATDPATTRHRSRRDKRQPLVMPYFSFAPRG